MLAMRSQVVQVVADGSKGDACFHTHDNSGTASRRDITAGWNDVLTRRLQLEVFSGTLRCHVDFIRDTTH